MRWLLPIPLLVAVAHAQVTAQKPLYSLHWQPTSAQTTLINSALTACAGSHTNGTGDHIWCVPATTGPTYHNQTAATANGLAMWNVICGNGGNCPYAPPYGGAVGAIDSGSSLVGEVIVVPADSWIFGPKGAPPAFGLTGGICNANNGGGFGCNGSLVEIDQPASGSYPGGYVTGVFPPTPVIIISSHHANFPPLGTRAIPENGDGGWNQPNGQLANVCAGNPTYTAPSGATIAEIAEGNALSSFFKAGCTGSDYYTLVDYNGNGCIQGSNGANGYVVMDMECTTYAPYKSVNYPDEIAQTSWLTQMVAPGMTGSRAIMIHDPAISGQNGYNFFTTALRIDTGVYPLVGHCYMSTTPPTGLTSTLPAWPDCGIIEPGTTYYIYLVGRNGTWEQPATACPASWPANPLCRGSYLTLTWSGLDAPADHMQVQPLAAGTGAGQCPAGATVGGLAVGNAGAGRGGLCVIDATHAWAAVQATLTSPRNGGVYNLHVETIPAALPTGCVDNCAGAFRSVFHDALVVDQGISIVFSCNGTPPCPIQPMNGGKQLILNAGGGNGTSYTAIQYPVTLTYVNGVNSGNFSTYATIVSGFTGTGYSPGDVLQLTNVSTGATVAGKIQVDSVTSSGGIPGAISTYHLTTDPVDIGTYGSITVTRSVSGGTGTGARFSVGGSKMLPGVNAAGNPIQMSSTPDQIVDVVNKTISGPLLYGPNAIGGQYGYLGPIKAPGQEITNRPFFSIAAQEQRGADTPSPPYEITVQWRAITMTNNPTNGIDYCALYNPANIGVYAGYDRYAEANLANGTSGTLVCYGIGTHWTDIASCTTQCDWGQTNNPGAPPPPSGQTTPLNPGIMNLGSNIHINSWTAVSDTEIHINVTLDQVTERGAWNLSFIHNWIHGYESIVTADSRQQFHVDGSPYVPCKQNQINCVAVNDSVVNTGFINNATDIELSDSVVDHIHDVVTMIADQKASAGIGGENLNFHNNLLSASSIVWYTGGAGADFARSPAPTSDVEFDHNYEWRPKSWVNGGIAVFTYLTCHASSVTYTKSSNSAVLICPQNPHMLFPAGQPISSKGTPVFIFGLTGVSSWMNGCANVSVSTVNQITLNNFTAFTANQQGCTATVQSAPADYTDPLQGSNSNYIRTNFGSNGWRICDQNGYTFDSQGNLASGNCFLVGSLNVKDQFELKEGRRIWIHDNVAWRTWISYVNPYGNAVYTPRNSTVAGTEASNIQDITMENNMWLNGSRGTGVGSGDPGVGYGLTALLSPETTQGSIAVLETSRFYSHNNLSVMGFNGNNYPATQIFGWGYPAVAWDFFSINKNIEITHETSWYMQGVNIDTTATGDYVWYTQPSQACGVAVWPQMSIQNSIGYRGQFANSGCYFTSLATQPSVATRPCYWQGGAGNDFTCRFGGSVISAPTPAAEVTSYASLAAPIKTNLDPTAAPIFKCELTINDELGQDLTTPECPSGIDYTFQNVAGWSDNSTGSWNTTDSTPAGVNWPALIATTKYVMSGSTSPIITPPPTGTTLGTGGIGPGSHRAAAIPRKKPKKQQ